MLILNLLTKDEMSAVAYSMSSSCVSQFLCITETRNVIMDGAVCTTFVIRPVMANLLGTAARVLKIQPKPIFLLQSANTQITPEYGGFV